MIYQKRNVAIIGLGEVGEAIQNLSYDAGYETFGYDLNPEKSNPAPDETKIDYLHICIPYNDYKSFSKVVKMYIKKFQPRLTLIHSTVDVGTTLKLIRETKNEDIVHTPIRGNHQDMANQVRQDFVKFIGAETGWVAIKAYLHLYSFGIRHIKCLRGTKTTELAKLLETTWYGVNIVFCQEADRIAKSYGLRFKDVVTKISKDGYFDADHTMPRPWKMFPGFIGGHCVMPNINILRKNRKSYLLDACVKSNELRKKEEKKK